MRVNEIENIDCLAGLQKLPDNSVDCCVTSPPYWGLRDYGVNGQLGLEESPELYERKMVEIFTEVKRVLKPAGTLWLNLGDSYAAAPKKRNSEQACRKSTLKGGLDSQIACKDQINKITFGLKAKDLVGIPWMIAFALRKSGWYLRSDIIWAKKSVMPESVTDRPTKSHEHIFLLSKSSKYYYDNESIKEVAIWDVNGTGTLARKQRQHEGNSLPTDKVDAIRPAGFKDACLMNGKHKGNRKSFRGGGKYTKGQSFDNSVLVVNETNGNVPNATGMRNKRDVWTVCPAQFPDAHFATFPEELIVDCIKAGCLEGGIVLDPFMGAGTTALVARKLNRNYIGFELNSEYVKLANKRLKKILGIFQ